MPDSEESFEEVRVAGDCHYDGKILRLEVDTVRLPDGTEAVREVIRHPGAAVMVPVADDGTVLFVRQFRYPTGEHLLELPAGKLDPGEAPESCAARETAEETGWRPDFVRPLGEFFTAPGFSDELIRAFVVSGLRRDADAVRDADELVEVRALSLAEFDKLLNSGRIRDAKTISAIALWRASAP